MLPGNFSTPNFAVCGATISPLNERSRKHRKPLPTRLLSPDIVVCIIYICYVLAPLLVPLLFATVFNTDNTFLSAVIALPVLHPYPSATARLVSLAAKVSTPVRYMIWPPDIPEWEDLVQDDGNGVKRPRTDSGVGNEWVSWVGLWWLLVWGCEVAVLLGGCVQGGRLPGLGSMGGGSGRPREL